MKYNQLMSIIMEGISKGELHKVYPKIDDSVFDTLVSMDPTFDGEAVGQYTTWLIRMYLRDKLDINDPDITSSLASFDRNSDSFIRKSITKYNSVEDLKATVLGSDIEDRNILSNGSKVLYSDSDWVVEQPISYEQSCEAYGMTDWCTASVDYGIGYWNSYTRSGDIYVVRNPKQMKPEFQAVVEDNDFGEIQDRNNNAYDIAEFFKRYPKIENAFKPLAPDYFTGAENMVSVAGRRIKFKLEDGIRVFKNIDISDAGLTFLPDFATL